MTSEAYPVHRPASAAAAALLFLGLFAAPPGHAQVTPPELPKELPTEVPELAPAFPIPPAVQRPLDVEEGDRLFVKKFKLKGVTDRPKGGIAAGDLERLLEDLRVQKQGLDKIGSDGFTDDERAQIRDFVAEVVRDPNLDMRFEDYEALVDKLRELRAEREAGMTIGQMQQVAAAVTEYYRSAGFILAQAFIPAQEVADGEVVIEVLEGELGNVLVEGNEKYDDQILARPFRELIDAPVTASGVEEAILLASDYPGVNLFGVFQPGRAVGTTDLVLNVQEEKRYELTTRFDNHGTRFTGEYRGFAELAVNSPTGAGDRLAITALQQFRPRNSFFGQVSYERPLAAGDFDLPGYTVGASIQRNPFTVGAELRTSDLTGVSKAGEAWVRKAFKRSRAANIYGKLALRRSQAVTLRAGRPISEDQLSMAIAEVSFDSIDAEARAINQGSVALTMGLGDRLGGNSQAAAAAQRVTPGRRGGSSKFAANDFNKVAYSFARLQKVSDNQSVLLRLDGQWSRSLLTSLEQYSIGGPSNVRAFPVSERQADTAVYASAEWSINAPFVADEPAFEGYTWGQILRVSFFADYAWSRINDPTPTDDAIRAVYGVGAGLSLNVPGKYSARLQYAHPLGKCKGSDDSTGISRSADPQDCSDQRASDVSVWWFDFTYQF